MSLRLLVVEDDPGFQDLVRALCERRGDSVDVASDGFLGLRLLSERRHDVVMTTTTCRKWTVTPWRG